MEPDIHSDSVEAIPGNENNIDVTAPLPAETEKPKDPTDWSKFNQEWVRKKDLLKKICRVNKVKVYKKEKHEKMCRKWRDIIW